MLDGGPTAPMRAAAAEPLLTDRPSGDESAGACCPCSGSRADSTGSPHNQLVTSPSRGDWSGRAHRKLGVCSVMMVVFFNVSGGPLGSEEVVRYGGPLIGLSSLVAFAAVYSVPQAMLTAELSTAFPDNGGYSLWAKAAFGDFWGVQQSYWSWFAGVTDSALYPVLLVSSAEQLFNSFGKHDELRSECHAHQHHAAINLSLAAEPRLFGTSSAHAPPSAPGLPPKPDDSNLWGCMFEESGSHECAAKLGVRLLVLGLFTLPNILSSKLVGHAMVGVGVFTILPFLVLSAWGVANGDFDAERLLQRPPGGVRWGSMLSVVFWSLEGFDNASTFAGEVNDPGRTYPRALGLAVALMLFTYLLPLGVGAAADPEWSCWKDGSLAYVARLIGGPVLGGWVLVSALVSNWGLFSAELLGDSYQLLGMAHVGLAPRVFGRRSRRFGTPLNAIMLQLFINAMLVGLDFDAIMVRLRCAGRGHARRARAHGPRARTTRTCARATCHAPRATRCRMHACARHMPHAPASPYVHVRHRKSHVARLLASTHARRVLRWGVMSTPTLPRHWGSQPSADIWRLLSRSHSP